VFADLSSVQLGGLAHELRAMNEVINRIRVLKQVGIAVAYRVIELIEWKTVVIILNIKI
jgi:hypothetical protein